ncbi:T9SS type A sorting domain-containing protein [Neolewinella litorea]|uniref:T9SS type A sorting domain-containing protein n=1 Tax=Neolewinella litorea TaxID=2562452 RepID=A0A4S4NZP6_9BACT|nr:T9SS type A sorting domain-containing protein [Neolewinella litorea]THH41780.1 T9SS type A sorting domain-containing protein [Neolewinella litorea]
MNNFTPFRGQSGRPLFALLLMILLGGLTTTSLQAQETPYKVPFAVFLEGECAEVGGNWQILRDTLASQDSFVVIAPGFKSMQTPPEDVPANRVRFRLNVLQSDDFHVWGRVRSAGPDEDSYWVRINEGEWVQWSNRLRFQNEWHWREVAGSPFPAPAGPMIIDFAFREPNTRLDKIYVSSMRASPTGLGGPAINCDEETDCTRFPEACRSAAWIEAECGNLSSDIKYTVNTSASNGGFLKTSQPSNLNVPSPTDDRAKVNFEVNLTEGGEYFLYFLMNAQNVGANSFWVKVDDSDWIDFSYEIGGADLKTTGFEWRMVNKSGDSTSFNLSAGMHTITVAKRESDTQLDKIYLGRNAAKPSGFGKFSLNCVSNALTPTRPPLDEGSEVAVYPNPAGNFVTFTLKNPTAGTVTAAVYDFSGRKLVQQQYGKTTGQLQGQLSVADLPAGLYRLVLATEAGVISRTFIKQ